MRLGDGRIARYPATSVLRPSRGRTLLMVLGSVVFVLCGWWMIESGKVFGWFAVAFFGICCVAWLVRLLPGACGVVVMKEGIAIRSFFRVRFYEWERVEGFGLIAVRNQLMVGFNEAACESRGPANLTQAVFGFSHSLPESFGYEAEQLAAILNQYRQDALESHALPMPENRG
jgi:hypothetical protein